LSESGSHPTGGLRERKKTKTRAAIQGHALRLFREQGYDATTVEQICDAAEVSESTFYRYFPAKPDVVLWDDLDPLFVQAIKDQPPEIAPLAAIRAGFRSVFGQLTPEQQAEQLQRITLSLAVPELRATMFDQFAQGIQLLTDTLAERTCRPSDDLALRTLAGAVVGAMMAVTFTIPDHPGTDIATLLDQALAHLEQRIAPEDTHRRSPRGRTRQR
jgi:AcrR family transcriptional regulator